MKALRMIMIAAVVTLAVAAALPAWAEDASTMAQAADVAASAPAEAPAEAPAAAPAAAPEKKAVFKVYADKYDIGNHYIPSGWMGDYGDITIDDGYSKDPHSGKSCIKISYSAKGSQGAGWMGIYWQNPANNWGSMKGGYDLSPYKKLTFWARGEKGGEVIAEFKVGGITGIYADTDSASMGPVTLTKEWKRYEIDLKGLDLSYISGGFEFSAAARDNADGFIIYLDDIIYE